MLRITPIKPLFPEHLKNIAQPPKDLYIESKNWQQLVNKPSLAIVGSRKVSPYGHSVTSQLAREVAARGVVIISGLALGVDSIAHEAALEVSGATIAVLPSGLSQIYPNSHTGLARRIVASGGALVSEHPPHQKVAFKSSFIARNRLIAGLADAVLLTEAAIGSGSLHTANFALEQGKDVLAVPGPITSDLSSGCNNLIKAGATPVTSADDILNIFNLPANAHTAPPHGANAAEAIILKLLHGGLTDIEELQKQSGLSVDEFQRTLSMLEITGQIMAHGNGTFTLK